MSDEVVRSYSHEADGWPNTCGGVVSGNRGNRTRGFAKSVWLFLKCYRLVRQDSDCSWGFVMVVPWSA